VRDLAALGLASVERALEADLPPRAERVATTATGDVWRLPLPGTPLAPGAALSGAPRGAGTGWIVLERFLSVGARELVRARFVAPRSESLAERRWNLVCALRAEGVGTAEPLCVARVGGGVFARRSFYVAREPEGARPLLEVLGVADAERRGAVCDGLLSLLERLARSSVELPSLQAAHLLVGRARRDCEAAPGGLAFGARPEVLVAADGASLAGARLGTPAPAAERRALVERVLSGLPPSVGDEVRERVAR
jgi:hypothetical protein